MSFKFECPHCRARLSAEPGMYGQTNTCPECQKELVVPGPNEFQTTSIDDDGNRVVRFLCPHCSRRLSAVSHQFGKEMPCPHADCRKPILVPRPEWKPIPTTILRNGSPDANDLIKKAKEMTGKREE